MSPARALVVGAGQRVQEAVLPVIASLAGELELAGVFARGARRLEPAPHAPPFPAVEVEPLAALDAARLRGVELCFVAVAKASTPEVLAHLSNLDPSATTLLVETPVLLYKHLGHAPLLRRFARTFVAEDCVLLPCLDPLDAALAAGVLGAPRSVVFSHSAWAYHGVALARRVLDGGSVRSGRRRSLGGRPALRELRFERGRRALMLEPRDYRAGRLLLACERGTLADHPLGADGDHVELAPRVEGGRCLGFAAGDLRADLEPAEASLMGTPEGPGVFGWMRGMKRVGLRRAFRAALAGRGYALELGLEDMVVDYHLDKFGRWLANPLTGPGTPLARFLR